MKATLRLIKKYWYILIILMAIGVIGWWLVKPMKLAVQEFTATRKDLTVGFTSSGTVKARRSVQLTFQTGGQVAWVGVEEGDRVRKWQGIASLDARQLEKNLKKELNDYMKVRWDFEGAREERGVTSDNLDKYTLSPAARRVLEKLQFDLNNAVLDVEIQTVASEFATIISPFAGIVTSGGGVYPGMNVQAITPIATVVDPESIFMEAQVDELDIGKVEIGQTAQIQLDAYAEEEIIGYVNEIGYEPISLSGGGTGYAIKIIFPPAASLRYKPGMNGDVRFVERDIHNAIVLPQEAIARRAGGEFVTVLTPQGSEERQIKIGAETENEVEVISSLQEGDKIIVREEKP